MSNNRDLEQEIDELRNKVARLELHTTVLKRHIGQLNARLRGDTNVGLARTPDEVQGQITAEDNTEEARRDTYSPAIEEEYERARRNIFLDCNDRHLQLGDRVYILTKGAHTKRSRRGNVSGFDQYRNRVIVTDETGIYQERAPKNLQKED